jgi:hypothetical protein
MKRIDPRAQLPPGLSGLDAGARPHPERLSLRRFEPVSTQWTFSNHTNTAPWERADIYPKLLNKNMFSDLLGLGMQLANPAKRDTKFILSKGIRK